MAEGGETTGKGGELTQSPVATKRNQRKDKELNDVGMSSQSNEAEQKSKRKGKKEKGQLELELEHHDMVEKLADTIDQMKDKCTELIRKCNYERALILLKELRLFHDTGTDGLGTRLQTIECELHLSSDNAEQWIMEVKELASTLDIDVVRQYANDLVAKGHHIRGIILYRITVDMIKTSKVSPNDVISYMRERCFDIGNCAKSLIDFGGRSREIGTEYGVQYLDEILAELRAVKDGDPANRADKEGKCLSTMAFLCICASLNEQAIGYAKEGLKVLDSEFDQNASKHKAYGWLLNNLGTANHNACHYDVAEPYYVAAIKSYGNAVDFLSEEEMKKELVLAKTNLGNSCKKLGKKTFLD